MTARPLDSLSPAYRRRIARGTAYGLTRQQARGHAPVEHKRRSRPKGKAQRQEARERGAALRKHRSALAQGGKSRNNRLRGVKPFKFSLFNPKWWRCKADVFFTVEGVPPMGVSPEFEEAAEAGERVHQLVPFYFSEDPDAPTLGLVLARLEEWIETAIARTELEDAEVVDIWANVKTRRCPDGA